MYWEMLYVEDQLLIGKVNELEGIKTRVLNMFHLHELFVDDVLVGYIRAKDDKGITVIPAHKFAVDVGKSFDVKAEAFHQMIDNFRTTKCLCLYPLKEANWRLK